MNKTVHNLSIAQTTNITNSSTSYLSYMSSPKLRHSSLDFMKKDLTHKQEKLTESLVNYSKELSRKIPAVAQRWDLENSRFKMLIKKKRQAQMMFKKSRSKELESLKVIENRVLLAESERDKEVHSLEEIMRKLKILRSKKQDYDECIKNMNLLSNEKVELEEKLKNIREYTEVSLRNLKEFENKEKELKKIESLFLNRLEEIYVLKEDVQTAIETVKNEKVNILSSAWEIKKEDEESLKQYLNELARGELLLKERNFNRKKELQEGRERIEEMFRVNRIEERLFENRKKRFSELWCCIQKKIEELKRTVSKAKK